MKFLPYITALIVGLLAAGCSDSDAPADGPAKAGLPTMGISIGLSSPSRAADGSGVGPGEFEEGVGLENYINVAGDDYRIYFFDTDNKYLATFEPFSRPVLSDPGDGEEHRRIFYNMMGEVPAEVGIEFKLLVLGNWGAANYPAEVSKTPEQYVAGTYELVKGATTIEDICCHANAQFAALASPAEGQPWLSSANRLIPFYGVREYDLNKYVDAAYIKDGKITKDIYVDLQSEADAVPMLRAMARVEVILDNPYASFASVTIKGHNTKGCCAPFSEREDWKWDYSDYFVDYKYNWTNNFLRDLHIPAGVKSTGDIALTKITERQEVTDPATGNVTVVPEKWLAYVPEYLNVGVDDACTIEVELANPDGSRADAIVWDNPVNTIYFSTNGSRENHNKKDVAATATVAGRYNIERNNIYRFNVVGMSTTLTCQVDIQPYAERVLLADYGLLRDERGDLMVLPDDDGNLPQWFQTYIKNNESKLPCEMEYDEATKTWHATTTPLEFMKGDYYAIVNPSNGDIKNAEIWLKDEQGCRVMTNFVKSDENDENCSTRTVIYFFGINEDIYHKDNSGYRRIHHFTNHNSIVLTHNEEMALRVPEKVTVNGVTQYKEGKLYLVESFLADPFVCWVIVSESGVKPVKVQQVDENGDFIPGTIQELESFD